MTEEDLKFFIDEWIRMSENTNNYVNRSLIVAALKAAEAGDAAEASRRLRQVVPPPPGYSHMMIDMPDFIIELENLDKGKK